MFKLCYFYYCPCCDEHNATREVFTSPDKFYLGCKHCHYIMTLSNSPHVKMYMMINHRKEWEGSLEDFAHNNGKHKDKFLSAMDKFYGVTSYLFS